MNRAVTPINGDRLLDATHVCTIGGDNGLVEFDEWAEVVDSRDDLRPEPFTGRDPATGEPMEYPPSATLVSLLDQGDVRGRFWYDENHRVVVGVAKPNDVALAVECAKEIANQLAVPFSER